MQAFLKSGKIAGNGDKKAGTSSGKPPKTKRAVPWVEKYRPKTVDEVVEQNEAVSVLQQCISGANFPNLLFYGPPGTGKTSTILAAARQLFGDIYRDRILELNASDERGIQIIRDKVKTFAQLTASGTRPDGKPCPPYKIIILDEADSMTHSAQAALRRTMEKESKTTRFCLICNYVSRIIDPLTSRCTKFRFKPLKLERISERLEFICKEENVKFDEESLKALVDTSGGDMRRAITCLQSCAKLRGSDDLIKIEDVYEVTGVVPSKWLDQFVAVCKKGDYDGLSNFLNTMMYEAYSGLQMLEQLNEIVVHSDLFNDKQKGFIGAKLGLVGYRLQDGGSEYLQLLDIGCTLMSAFKLI
ncbi:PREDICTED: replication factor C subunit 4 [Nicrophorus vespilloides]|uniref:Replication factor C subunit 4 n=1 Tax=Nicrophorus vespilloides TaxID=110193 RepID=A0ABM1M5S1_NICVS|nr:PREDICTED: replication factor C subunit 4 [Nicrophorus vespilloides]